MSNEEYLEYLRTLYDRASTRSQRNGITKWALIGAAAYLLSELVSAAPRLVGDSYLLVSAFVVYLHFHVATFIVTGVVGFGGLARSNPLDYRFSANLDLGDIPRDVIELFVLLFVPSWVAAYLIFSGLFSPWHVTVLAANGLLAVSNLLIFFGLIAYIVSIVHKTGLPSPFLLASTRTTFLKRCLATGTWLWIFLALANIYWLVRIASSLGEENFKNVVIVGVYSSLLSYVFVRLLQSMSEDRQLQTISRLERDILFHNLSQKQIEERFEEELIGREVGALLKDKVRLVREIADVLISQYDSFDFFAKEIKALDDNLQYERKGRVEAFLAELEKRGSHYQKNMTILLDWLRKANSTREILFDKHIQQLLSEMEVKLREIHSEVLEKRKKLLNVLEQMRNARADQIGATDVNSAELKGPGSNNIPK